MFHGFSLRDLLSPSDNLSRRNTACLLAMPVAAWLTDQSMLPVLPLVWACFSCICLNCLTIGQADPSQLNIEFFAYLLIFAKRG